MNVIFIAVDSLRQDHVSFYGWGNFPLETPNFDRFARESIVFENCYPSAPVPTKGT